VIDFVQHMEGWLCTSINVIRRLLWRSPELVCPGLRFAGVFVLVGSVYNPGRLNFGEVEVFLSRLSVFSLEYDHLSVLGDFNLDILINPGQSLTARYREILNSFLNVSVSCSPCNYKTCL
jgi:hypothetical protein